MKSLRRHIVAVALTMGPLACSPTYVPTIQQVEVQRVDTVAVERLHPSSQDSWVETTLTAMSLREKVGQLIMAKGFGHYISTDSDEFDRLAQLVQDERIGGLIVFQGDVYSQAVLLNKLQRLAKIPLLVAADYERGVAMRTRRGTYFPDAMAIGATRNPEYAYRVGRAIATEARALGVHQNLAPVADVNNNPDNPVINTRSYGEDPTLVAEMVEASIRGMNEGGVISTAKHFPGHGDTGVDSHLDLPILPFGRGRLDSVELVSFRAAIKGGAQSIMVAHLEVPAIDPTPGMPATLSRRAITDLLRNELGFDGLIVTDAMDMAGLTKGYSIGGSAVRAINAGVDILLMPTNEKVAIDALVDAVNRGEITQERLDESVRKIIEVKKALGLNENTIVDIDKIADRVATREHWMLAKEVARDAVTILRNLENTLPLQLRNRKKVASVIISDVDDYRTEVNRPGSQYPNEVVGAYFNQHLRKRHSNIEAYRISPSSNELVLDSVLTQLESAQVVIMPLYMKVRSSSGKIGMPEKLNGFLGRLSDLKKPTVVVSFGNPYSLGAFPNANVLLCAYSDAEILVEAAVEAMFGEIPVRGKLPVTIPDQFVFGSGMEYAQACLRSDDPSYAGFDKHNLEHIDQIVEAAIGDSAFPAAQVLIAKDGVVAYNKSFGTYSYDPSSGKISARTQFDLASLTKVIATTASVMKLIDQGKLALDDRVSEYVPRFVQGRKSAITIRHLLTHTAGFAPFRRLWTTCKTSAEALDSVYATEPLADPGDTTIYSDIGMIVLGKVVEEAAGISLDEFARREFYEPLGMSSTGFRPAQAMRSQIAPTELDTIWRKRTVHGTVHDENAEILGGVSGHSGLFSNASDLALFMQMIMNGGYYGGVRYLSDSIVHEFTRRQSASSTRALGWDTKSATSSSAGEQFSSTSFGHTGFTGTSIWADPERNLFVVFLTNRVHPTRANSKIFKIRPVLHDAVIQALVNPSGSKRMKAYDATLPRTSVGHNKRMMTSTSIPSR
ncbi:MAG: serine hydrolase [Ignavibacteriae bacterium]|nr:serine hydrolase [Ignavibacteriota bacterium]